MYLIGGSYRESCITGSLDPWKLDMQPSLHGEHRIFPFHQHAVPTARGCTWTYSYLRSSYELLEFERRCLRYKLPPTVQEDPLRGFHLIARGERNRHCTHCYAQLKKQVNTPYICRNCSVPLHPDCFEEYHKIHF